MMHFLETLAGSLAANAITAAVIVIWMWVLDRKGPDHGDAS